jgi:hypothetical protein
MMYNEFLELTGSAENQVDPKIYFLEIEPLYMDSPEVITKELFCKQWVMFFNENMSDFVKRIDKDIYKNVNKKMVTQIIVVTTIGLMKELFRLL